MATQEDFELALAFIKLVDEVESKRSMARTSPSLVPNPPESLGVPRLTYAVDRIFNSIESEELLNIWQTLQSRARNKPPVRNRG